MIFYTYAYRFKPQVAQAQDGVTEFKYILKLIISLTASAVLLSLFFKGGMSMINIISNLVNLSVSYLISVLAGQCPVT